ncbi:MAG TPA: hypothetical protein VKQ30_15150 [Ktedonobacterales bacterium]|nr:hypothetical protein [Ktedonobacterales bacterium]
MVRTKHPIFFSSVLGVVLSNYIAQIPYYLYLYYFPHRAAPAFAGSLLLIATLLWFLAGYIWLARGSRAGYWLLLSFLITEVGFYLHNMVIQVTHGFAPFFHLQSHDPLLFVVFAIGYLNFLAGAYFIYFLLRHRSAQFARVG